MAQVWQAVVKGESDDTEKLRARVEKLVEGLGGDVRVAYVRDDGGLHLIVGDGPDEASADVEGKTRADLDANSSR